MQKLNTESTLNDLIKYLFVLYGPRNNLYLSGRSQRIEFLMIAVGDLHESIRKDFGKEKIGFALARIFARVICVAHSFENLDLVTFMCKKYQMGMCTYCFRTPCQCEERRGEVHIALEVSSQQYNWSMIMWQQHFQKQYGDKNRQSGIDNLTGRLFKEVTEILLEELKVKNKTANPEDSEQRFAFEMADVIAWTIAIANQCGIHLGQTVVKRYGSQGCWKCHQIPCKCGPFIMDSVDWALVK